MDDYEKRRLEVENRKLKRQLDDAKRDSLLLICGFRNRPCYGSFRLPEQGCELCLGQSEIGSFPPKLVKNPVQPLALSSVPTSLRGTFRSPMSPERCPRFSRQICQHSGPRQKQRRKSR